MRTYAPTLALSGHASSGWVAAKLFERAAANLGPSPTSAQMLGGLWSISNDTLGGLTAPLTFVRDQPAPPRYCFFPMGIEARRWVAYSSQATCEAPGA